MYNQRNFVRILSYIQKLYLCTYTDLIKIPDYSSIFLDYIYEEICMGKVETSHDN